MIATSHHATKRKIIFTSNPGCVPKPLAFAIRVALASALTTGVAVTHAQTTASEKGGSEDVRTLPAINVSAERTGDVPSAYAGGQTARGARLGMLGNEDTMSTPFNVSSYTSQMIQDRQASTAADIVAQDPSVRSTGQNGGMLDAFFIRGFPIGEGNMGEVAFDGMYGVAPNYRILTDYVERIEVIKGPAALLYGMSPNSGVGGVINIVPKRAPLEKDLTRFTGSYATESQVGGHLDVGRRFGPGREFGVRFNGSYQQGDTAIDKQEQQTAVGAVALDYVGEKLTATLDVLSQREELEAPSRPFMLANGGLAVPTAPDGQSNLTQAWEWADVRDQSVLLRGEYALNHSLTLFAGAGRSDTQVDRVFGTHIVQDNAGNTLSTPGHFKFDIDRSSAEAGMRGRFETGAVRHTLTFQATTYSDQLNRGSVNGTAIASNLYAPTNAPVQNIAAPAQVPRISETTLQGIALSDTLSMMNDSIQLTLGARHQQVESENFDPATGAITSTYDKSAVTPLVGIVFKPWQNVSLYANYIEGLSKGDVAPSTADNAGEVFAPYKAKQKEIGVKIDHGRLMTTVSLFQITKASGQLTGDVFGVDGEQRNRGLEVNVSGEVRSNLRLLGGVTLIDAELTKTNNTAALGRTPIGVPSVQANLGAEWDTPWAAGLTLTGGVAYTGKQDVNLANTQRLPTWTKVDLGARYSTKIAGKSTTFRANLLNAFDRDYWSGAASWGGFVQGAPRTLLLSASVDF